MISALNAPYTRPKQARPLQLLPLENGDRLTRSDEAIDWFVLDEGRFVLQAPDEQGVYASRVFPGLRLPVPALLNDKLADVLATVQQGAQTSEHAAFVGHLGKGVTA
jgi:hypothetical protein